jgi:serine/threonine protein kinase
MRKAGHEHIIGRTIAGKFVVENLIGSGAMGAVFRARQIALEKTVAIKVLHGEHADDPTFAARFHREAKAASRLNHPNSMQVLDFGAEPDGLLYIAMEYLDGRSLHSLLREEWPLAPARLADILMQTLAALAVAHDMGVVHRDLKPENVMVLRGTDDDGRPRDIVKVCDFGIAKITDPRAYRSSGPGESNAPVTTAGFLVGTPEYMSPEQGRGEKLDSRSDLYSVGVILFEMLTKRVPFEAENAIGVVLKHVTEEPPRPSLLAPGVDPRLEAICLRAIRKFREERYASARDMRAELRLVADGRPTAPGAGGAPRVQVMTESPASVSAATVQMPVASRAASAAEESPVKPTLVGTTSAIARPKGRRELVLAGLALAAVGAAGTVATMLVRARPRSVTVAAPLQLVGSSARSSSVEPSETEAVPDLAAADEPAPRGSAAPHGAAHAKPTGSPSAKPIPSTTAPATATATPTATATATATATPTATPTPMPALPEPADPSFDPERAYVEVGLINVEGVRERAVRGALHGIGLAQCYKGALKTRGARATGVATLNLSLDENGATRSAIVTGADFLPGLARCLQGAGTGVHVAKSQIDSGGGVAEITLAFKAP